MNLRISVSRIEQFRKYLDEEYNGFITQQSVIDDIRGVSIRKPAMILGLAYHALLEWDRKSIEMIPTENSDGDTARVRTPDMDTHIDFHPNLVQPALQYRLDHPHMIHEVPVTKRIKVGGFNITISGRIDGLEGFEGRDAKTGDRGMDVDLWGRSYQWKYYCWMAGLLRFHYDIFQFIYERKQLIGVKYDTFDFKPNMGNENDCIRLVERFLDFCQQHKLMDFLIDKYAFEKK